MGDYRVSSACIPALRMLEVVHEAARRNCTALTVVCQICGIERESGVIHGSEGLLSTDQ